VSDLETLPGINAGLAAELRAVGVRDVATLRELGPVETAARLAELGLRGAAVYRRALEQALGGAGGGAGTPPTPAGIAAIVLPVGDLDAAVAHYARLGLAVRERGEAPRTAVLDHPAGPALVLREDTALPPAAAPAGARVWFAVDDPATYHELLGHRAATAGGAVLEVTDAWGNTIGFTGRR